MKILKWLAIGIAGLIALLVVAVAIISATFDPNKFKDDITRLVQEKKQRTLNIPGNISLKVFPKLGVELGQVTLSEFKSDKQFMKLERAKLYVDLLPLLKKELLVDRIEVDGLVANVVKGRDGKFNFDDLLSKEEKSDDKLKFDVEGIKLSSAAVTYRDEASGQTISLAQLNLTTGRIADKVPGKIDLTAKIEGSKPSINAQLNVVGGILFDLEKKQYGFSSLEAKAAGSVRLAAEKGKPALDLAGLDAKVSAGELKFDVNTLAIDAQKLAVEARGTLDREPFELKLSAPKLAANGKTQAVSAEKLALEAKGRRGTESGTVKLDAAKFEADAASHKFAIEGLSASGSGAMPGLLLNDFKARAPKILINLGAGQIALDGVTLNAVGKRGDEGFDLKVDAPKLAVNKDSASGEAITGSLKLSGRELVDAKFSLSEVKGSAKALTVGRIALDIAQAKFGDTVISGSINTTLTASLEARQFDLPRLSADLSVANPQMPMKSVKLPINGSLRADLTRETASADISTKFDESAIQAKLGVAKFKNAAITFDINVDRLNIDKYFPPKAPGDAGKGAPASPEKPFDLSGLKALNASGTIKVGQLQVNNVKASNVSMVIKAAGGKLDVNPINAGLYQGTLAGVVSVNAVSNSFAIRQTLTGVNINPLMKDAINKDILEGRGNVLLDITTSGNTVTALKKALNGSTSILLKDGAYKGINLAKSFREAKAALSLNKSKVQEARKEDKTDFTEMKISAQIKNGIATSTDLDAKSPFVRLGGAGTVDIPAGAMDYLAKATVVNTSGGQDAKDLAALKGLTIPVKINGPFEALKYDVQYGAVAGSLATEKVKDAVKDKLGERLGLGKPQEKAATAPGQPTAPAQQQSSQDKAREKLRGLLGR